MPIVQILMTSTSSSSPPAPTTELVMALIADDYSGSGTTWTDSSGASHPGTLVNTPAFTNTEPNYFTFDRNSLEYIQGPAIGDLATWTIESWFRISEPLSNMPATAIITTTYDDGTNYGTINYTLSNFVEGGNGNDSHLTAGFYSGGSWYTTSGFIPTVGTWYHVVGTYDGTTIKQWVNGTLDTTRTVVATPTANGGPVRIARRWDGPAEAQYYFPGDIATAKIYNYALTESEITSAYNSSRATYPTITLTPATSNVDEGSSLTITISGTNITDGTYYWTVSDSGNFGTASGEVSITSNSGSFSVTPTADVTTEGNDTFTVSLRSGSISGTVLTTSSSITINDTSIEPTYTWNTVPDNGDEGSPMNLSIDTTGVADDTTLYWNVTLAQTTRAADFEVTSGSFTITSGTGSFSVTPSADGLTEGNESFTVEIRTGSTSGTVVLTSSGITINDTSYGTVSPMAYKFSGGNGSGAIQLSNNIYSDITNLEYNSSSYVDVLKASYPQPEAGWQWRSGTWDTWKNIVGVTDSGDYWTLERSTGGSAGGTSTGQLQNNNNADWALGTTWTIEFWIKPVVIPGVDDAPNNPQRILSQNTDSTQGYHNLDICLANGIVGIANLYFGFDAPAEMIGVWSHVAFSSNAGNVKGFLNGLQVFDYPALNISFTNGTDDLVIGANGTRTSPNANEFNGLITDIRISNTARYASAFNPAIALSPTRDANTKLLLTPKEDAWFSSEGVHYLSYSNRVTVDYPNVSPGPFSLQFDFGQTDYLAVGGTNSDWNLGTTYTVEWWSKANRDTSDRIHTVMSQQPGVGIDIFYDQTQLKINNSTGGYVNTSGANSEPPVGGVPNGVADWNGQGGWNQGYYANLATTGGTGTGLTVNVGAGGGGYINIGTISIATPGSGYTNGDVITINNENNLPGSFTITVSSPTWTHVAVVNDAGTLAIYYDGVAQTLSSYSGPSWTNTDFGIAIGERGFNSGTTPNGFQYFDGKLAMIRISSTAKYSTTFTPTITYGVESDTKLFLSKDVPLADASASAHTITNNGVATSTNFPAP